MTTVLIVLLVLAVIGMAGLWSHKRRLEGERTQLQSDMQLREDLFKLSNEQRLAICVQLAGGTPEEKQMLRKLMDDQVVRKDSESQTVDPPQPS